MAERVDSHFDIALGMLQKEIKNKKRKTTA